MRFKKKKIRLPWFYKKIWNLNDEDALWFVLNFHQSKIDRYGAKKKLNKVGELNYKIKNPLN